MFYRTKKIDNYTKIDNSYLKDTRLSLKAKGLLTIILSLPDTWRFSNAGLCSLCNEGKLSVDNTIKELKKYNYLILTKKQDNKGKYYYDYDIYESPDTKPGNLDSPYMDN